jgi:predicted transcriptional regulator
MGIMHQILETARSSGCAGKGATRANIMYRAFLSHIQLKGYLRVLIENGCLTMMN